MQKLDVFVLKVKCSAKVRSTLSAAACTGAASCFLKTASGAPGTNLAHLEEQRFVVVDIRSSAAVKVVATLTFSRARTASAEAGGRAMREESASTTRTSLGAAFGHVGSGRRPGQVVARIVISSLAIAIATS